MKSRMGSLTVIAAALLAWTAVTPSFADDGDRLFRTISNPPGQVGSPEPEGEHAFVQYLNFYVPSQASDGTLSPVQYINADGALVKEMTKARPLIAFFLYGPVISFDEPSTSGFPGHGRRDAFAAVSLNDGTTWKRRHPRRTREPTIRPYPSMVHRPLGMPCPAVRNIARAGVRENPRPRPVANPARIDQSSGMAEDPTQSRARPATEAQAADAFSVLPKPVRFVEITSVVGKAMRAAYNWPELLGPS